jgi:hypothetical protein
MASRQNDLTSGNVTQTLNAEKIAPFAKTVIFQNQVGELTPRHYEYRVFCYIKFNGYFLKYNLQVSLKEFSNFS